jgi:2-hydroxychromene-2-carboxylate isomerase
LASTPPEPKVDDVTGGPAFVDFHFDVMCPYAYQTSRWIREVRRLTGLTVNWRFFSLEEINRQDG